MKLKDSIILIFSVIIAIVVGVFIGIKITDNKRNDEQPKNNINNNQGQNNVTNDDNENKIDVNISLTELYSKKDIGIIYHYDISQLIDDINLKENFEIKNLKTKEGLNYKVSCSKYEVIKYFEENDFSGCSELKLSIDNTDFMYHPFEAGDSSSETILITNEYIIKRYYSGGIGAHGPISIYKDGNLILSVKDYADTSYFGSYDMKYFDNKLFFIAVLDNFGGEFSLNYIDMSKNTLSVTKIRNLNKTEDNGLN